MPNFTAETTVGIVGHQKRPMSRHEDTPSIIDREITSFRGGQRLAWRDLTATEKRDYLFESGIQATAYERYPDEARPDVAHGFLQFTVSALQSLAHRLLSESLTRQSDELATPKPKLFHTYGTTAKVLFNPEPGSPYTGFFAEPAHGLARFSYAGPVAGVGVVPGLGLKFPVDGDRPSENAVVMRMLDPQSHNSVFENPFSNILPVPRLANVVMRVVKARFETVVAEGRGLHQPVDNLARVNARGQRAAEARAPHHLILVPTDAARRASDRHIDFRDDLARNIPSGTRIYDVLGLTEAEDTALGAQGKKDLEELVPHAAHIGSLSTESEFIASKYGDYRLFFKHSEVFLREEFR